MYQGNFFSVWSCQLSYPYIALQTSQDWWVAGSPRQLAPFIIQIPRSEISESKGTWGVIQPRGCFCRKTRNRRDLKNARFMWFTPCFSNRHLQWIHYPLSELFKIITEKNSPFHWSGLVLAIIIGKMPEFIWLRPVGVNAMHHRKFNIKIYWEKKIIISILILKYFFRFID